jgi:hypothetical protein
VEVIEFEAGKVVTDLPGIHSPRGTNAGTAVPLGLGPPNCLRRSLCLHPHAKYIPNPEGEQVDRKPSIEKGLWSVFAARVILTAGMRVLYSKCSSQKETRTPTRWDLGLFISESNCKSDLAVRNSPSYFVFEASWKQQPAKKN